MTKLVNVQLHETDLIESTETLTELKVDDSKNNFLSPMLIDKVDLASERRKRKRPNDEKSVHPADVNDEVANGWIIQRPGKRSTRLKRQKSHDKLLEDRVWCLLNAMGCSALNGTNFKITFTRSDGSIGTKQIDVYAEDEETALVIECKSREVRGRRSLQKDIHETISLQSYFRKVINRRFVRNSKPKIIWLYATQNILWSKPDIERASARDIKILTENELQYFETFIRHMGPAGKYQILGEFLKGQKVPGLANVKLPAICGKIGGNVFYSFVTTPRNLLKIAFINHQALNHPDGRPAYQRMISSSRIRDIGVFIKKGGFFPTNILVNFSDAPRFDLISNSENTDPNIKFGWITLPSKYRSAWIIDGQHRLYGFSRLDDEYLDQSLFVLAFEKMAVQKEADLFITINHKQKSVPKSLLLSLLADIRVGDSDPSTALSALCSAVVRTLNTDNSSPFVRRFAIHGVPPEPGQNLTISEVVNGLRRSGLIGIAGKTLIPGPLAGATDEATIQRAATVLRIYFEEVRSANPERWEAGRTAFIAVNPGIRAHLTIVAEAVNYLRHKQRLDFYLLKPETFAEHIVDFCEPIFNYIRDTSDGEVQEKFSRKFGEGGVKEYSYHLMQILSDTHDQFGSEDFQRWVEQRSSEKIDEVNQFLMKLAERLTDYLIDTLKTVHGTNRLQSGEPAFWENGIESSNIREKAYRKQQDDKKTRRKPKEAYLDIIDFTPIVKQKDNWDHFEHVFSNPRAGDRKGNKYYLNWIQTFNDLRNIAAHKNQLKTYTDDDLEFVEWLRTEVSPKIPEKLSNR